MKQRLIFGVAISIVFVYLALRKVDFTEMKVAFQQANYLYFLPALVFMFFSLWLRAFRWKYFLRPIKLIGTHSLFSSMMIGYMANNLFPLRAGEFLRAYSIGKSENISITSSLATIIVERIIDVFSLLFLLAITLVFYPFPSWVKNSGYVTFAITASSLIFLLILIIKPDKIIGLVRGVFKPLPTKVSETIIKILKSFIEGLAVFKSSRHYLIIVALSIAIWLSYAAIIYASFHAFGFVSDYRLSPIASFVVLVMISLSVMIPSSPGYVGTFHYLCAQGLVFLGLPQTQALSFAVLFHIVNFIPMTLTGLIYFWKENLRFSDVMMQRQIVH